MAKHSIFKALNLHIMLWLYRLIWWICIPVILIYLYLRGRREPDYFRFLGERFGHHTPRKGPHIWIHAVSLGELRSAAPLSHFAPPRPSRANCCVDLLIGRRQKSAARSLWRILLTSYPL